MAAAIIRPEIIFRQEAPPDDWSNAQHAKESL
jgi:hypothetical protein